MQLTPHFSLHEFTVSQAAARSGQDIVPTANETQRLRELCIEVLEPLRVRLGRVITVTSGLRPKWLNDLIGGAPNSAHLYGCAADIIVQGMTPLQVCRTVEKMALPVDQCILEFGRWTHVSIRDDAHALRRQYLTASLQFGRTIYTPGFAIAQA